MVIHRVGAGVFLGTTLLLATPASAAVPHVIQPGETLSGIAAANGLSAESVASFNGVAADTQVVIGQTLQVPSAEEVGAVLAAPAAPAAPAAAPGGHVVQPGETLSGVAAANGVSAESLAAQNGLAADAYLIEGQTIQVPTAGAAPAPDPAAAEPAAEPITPAPGMGHIDSPWGPLHLDSAAADSFNAMADAAMAQFGIDLHPDGTVSAYRTSEQQAALYEQFLAGTGAPANPPGSSSHELGVAVDLATPEMRSVVDQIGGQFGWSGTIPDEWWHVSYGGG